MQTEILKMQTNLLRKRRKSSGISYEIDLAKDKKKLSVGIKISFILIISTVSIILVATANLFKLLNTRHQLRPFEEEYNLVQGEVILNQQTIQSMAISNKKLAKSIAGISSGSALLKELSNIIPKAIELKEIDVGIAGLKLIGITPDKNGLKMINTFQLSLSSSPFFERNSVKIVKATKKTPFKQDIKNEQEDSNNYLQFEILANFKESINVISKEYLESLGSLGLAKRIEIMKTEGLIE